MVKNDSFNQKYLKPPIISSAMKKSNSIHENLIQNKNSSVLISSNNNRDSMQNEGYMQYY